MASEELDRFAVHSITHVLYALICLQLRSTLTLLVLTAGRRHRLMVQEGANSAHLLPQEPKEISGTSVNLFLLGDAAYPLLDWLITDYTPSLHLTAEQESFNAYLRSARTTVDIAFGKLKSRWRVLLRKCNFHYTFIPYVIATCCALHNFCEAEEEGFSPAWTEEAARMECRMPQPDVCSCSESECSDGQKVRLSLTEYLRTNVPLHKSEF